MELNLNLAGGIFGSKTLGPLVAPSLRSGSPQPRALGSLNDLEPLVSMSNYYLDTWLGFLSWGFSKMSEGHKHIDMLLWNWTMNFAGGIFGCCVLNKLDISTNGFTLCGHTNSSKRATYIVTHWFTTTIQPLFHPLPPPPPLLLYLPDIESFPNKTDRFLVLVFFLEIYEKTSDLMVTNTPKKFFHHNFPFLIFKSG